MDKIVTILNKNDEIIANAVLEDMGSGKAVLSLSEGYVPETIKSLIKVHFRLREKYVDIYEGTIYGMEGNRLFLKNVIDSSKASQEDVKIDMEYETTIASHENKLIKNLPVRMKDISCTGLCFSCENELNTDVSYEIVIPITKIPIILNFKIVRKLKKEGGEFIYGCAFIDLETFEEKMLRETVFRLQRQSAIHYEIL